MNRNRNDMIASAFGARAQQYDAHAGLQARVAAELAHEMPRLENAAILEIGCGTGLFTEHLLGRYPNCHLYISDLSSDMLKTCRSRIGPHQNIHYICCDGEHVFENETLASRKYDVIATSMTIQWFQNPQKAMQDLVELLAPTGELYYATLGNDCFPEWRSVFDKLGFEAGAIASPEIPGAFKTENITVSHENALNFFNSMKAIGATTPGSDYRPLSPGKMRQALKKLDDEFQGNMTWNIQYGKLAKR